MMDTPEERAAGKNNLLETEEIETRSESKIIPTERHGLSSRRLISVSFLTAATVCRTRRTPKRTSQHRSTPPRYFHHRTRPHLRHRRSLQYPPLLPSAPVFTSYTAGRGTREERDEPAARFCERLGG